MEHKFPDNLDSGGSSVYLVQFKDSILLLPLLLIQATDIITAIAQTR